MQIHWDDTQPIYLQLRDKVLNMILDGSLQEGDALPSVRNISAEYQLNPITVSKAYQLLVESELAEKRRGLGMFVTEGAKEKLLKQEREQFLTVEWPALLKKIERLQISLDDLFNRTKAEESDHE
ncbi:MAG: GntR family transcriptional regulator [Kangiella sp.]|uniref:GntR family transcriptional regulator n=1 Tax=Kangiella aquimarina TaxID=261965 RepID=A0ABZ0X6H9_9GAMM|nr:GntR family transcriptional regulator [Kangiella aquimarina]MBD3668715.1 GntR family transcriptional regulator [Kangiella sp.]WQG86225.1 GntR family transcriptional regulator [Kangiella aquimarina]